MSGVKISPECVTEFSDFKMGRSKLAYISFALSGNLAEIVVERRGAPAETLQDLIKGLPSDAPRYIVTHYSWDQGQDGRRSRLVFIHWNPPMATLKNKMIYAATKQSFKQVLTGLGVDVQAGDASDLTAERILEQCQRYNKQ